MKIKNLGPISSNRIDLNKGMIFIGPNNSGKTYLTYTLYAILNLINTVKCNFITQQEARTLLENGKLSVDISKLKNELAKSILKKLKTFNQDTLPEFFNVASNNFSDTFIEVSEEEVIKIIDFLYTDILEISASTTVPLNNKFYWLSSEVFKNSLKAEITIHLVEDTVRSDNLYINKNVKELTDVLNTFSIRRLFFSINNILYIPAERNGLNVFRKELLANRSSLFDSVERSQRRVTKYPKPIADYLNYLNQVDISSFFSTSDMKLYDYLSEKVIKGKFEKVNDDLFYRQFFRKDKSGLKFKRNNIPFHIASSSAKSLYGLDVYFEHLVSKGDVLFIDEPEMNLDPTSQANMAEFLVKCIDYGIKVIISTHSYNLVKQFINLSLSKGRNDIILYEYTDKKNSNSFIGKANIGQLSSISVFNDINEKLIDEYYEIIERLEEEDDKSF